jgi:hypothetical protein
VFLQEPLDRGRARFVRTNVDIADALSHSEIIVWNACCRERAIFYRSDDSHLFGFWL